MRRALFAAFSLALVLAPVWDRAGAPEEAQQFNPCNPNVQKCS